MPPLIAVLLGGITGVGGGTIRDVLLARIPSVLRADVYATAALAGSAVVVIGRRLGLSPSASAFLGGLLCFDAESHQCLASLESAEVGGSLSRSFSNLLFVAQKAPEARKRWVLRLGV
jgi:uncharacterized membrane protein YeiH